MGLADMLALRKQVREAVAKRRGARRLFTATPPPSALVAQYTRVLVALSREMDRVMFAVLSDRLAVRVDADETPLFTEAQREAAIAEIRKRLQQSAANPALLRSLDGIAKKANDVSLAQWKQQLQRTLGIQPSEDLDLSLFVNQFRKRNTELIKSLADDKVERVHTVLVEDPSARVETIAIRIIEQTGATESRAALIARDQVLKLNAEITEQRHRGIGIEEYEWSTSSDERVREGHADLDGKRFKYSAPPVVDRKSGRKANPGMDFQCRCVAIPILPGIE
jgi:SPP1 gp7 family putative phage head morphogenesis protein